MLAPSHATELYRALSALETVIGLRLEERRASAVHAADPATRTQALATRPLGLDGSDGLPHLRVYAGDGPLAQVVGRCGLSEAQALVLTAAIAPEVDERFAALYGLLSDRDGVDGLTGEVVRTLVARTFAGRLAAADVLAADGLLRSSRLLHVELGSEAVLAGRVTADPELVAFVLARSPELPRASADFPASPLATVHTFADLVVTSTLRGRLERVLDRARHARRVLDDWGFADHHDGVRGTLVLFHGPPGTGKTMAAAVLAREAAMPAYRIDLSALVSKYIGETEKNLARVFDRAEAGGWLLFFDEADAVFGRRTEVSDAHDRYANQEVSYLLQRIEDHPGMVILATNLKGNLDDAFQRRIDLEVEFTAPGPTERAALWRGVLPGSLPVGEVDLRAFADRYELTGAAIRDAALDAAYLAAADGQVVTHELLERAVRGQYAKQHRAVPPPL
jgi:hypothetical protein